MIYLVIILAGFGFFEIRAMLKNKMKNEIKIWIVMAVMTLAVGYLYLSNPLRESLVSILLNLLGMEY